MVSMIIGAGPRRSTTSRWATSSRDCISSQVSEDACAIEVSDVPGRGLTWRGHAIAVPQE